jgi:flagellar FliL protein
MSEAAEEKAPAAPAGIPMKMVIIIVGGVLLLALGGAFAMMKMMGGSSAEKAPAEGGKEKAAAAHGAPEEKAGGGEHGAVADASAIADLDPFIVNLADSPEIRYLKVTLKVEADNSGTVEQIKARTPQIRDAILVLLTSLDSATARSPQGKHKLRDDITERINGLLPKKSVKSTYFTEFVIQ